MEMSARQPDFTVTCPVCGAGEISVWLYRGEIDDWWPECLCHESYLVKGDLYHDRVWELAEEELPYDAA